MYKLLLPMFLLYCEFFMPSFITAYSKLENNEQARKNSKDIIYTISPLYVSTAPGIELKLGEVINHSPNFNYSNIDEKQLIKLNELENRNSLQKRFHPPANFHYGLTHSNDLKLKTTVSSLMKSSPNNKIIYSKPSIFVTYEYPMNIGTNIKYMASTPKSISDSFPIYSHMKFPDIYFSNSNNKSLNQFLEYDSKLLSLDINHSPKSVQSFEYNQSFENISSYTQDPYHNESLLFDHNEVIYDYTSDDHHFQYDNYYSTTTTERPEIMDQRVNKRPHSYYYIGKKLWYIPLYFSIYFIIYVAALVLKSIARHKINFPTNFTTIVENTRMINLNDQNNSEWINYVIKVLESIEKYAKIS